VNYPEQSRGASKLEDLKKRNKEAEGYPGFVMTLFSPQQRNRRDFKSVLLKELGTTDPFQGGAQR
jgi:hypothetical protein